MAERAREESWSYEKFLRALLATELSARDSHGGENRIKAARFPARKTLEEFDFAFQRSVKKQVIEHLEHLWQLDFLHGKERDPSRTARDRQDTSRHRVGPQSLPDRPAGAVRDRRPHGSQGSAKPSAKDSWRPN